MFSSPGRYKTTPWTEDIFSSTAASFLHRNKHKDFPCLCCRNLHNNHTCFCSQNGLKRRLCSTLSCSEIPNISRHNVHRWFCGIFENSSSSRLRFHIEFILLFRQDTAQRPWDVCNFAKIAETSTCSSSSRAHWHSDRWSILLVLELV